MLFFFTSLIALILLMFSVLKQETNRISNDLKLYNNTINNSKIYHKAVYKYCDSYYQTGTGNSVYKKTDSKGKKWWYYIKTNEPMKYLQLPELINNYNFDTIKSKNAKKKWFTLKDYWDDSIFSVEPYFSISPSHLDDYTLFPNFIEISKHNKYLFDIYKIRNNNKSSLEWNEYCLMPPEDKEKIEEYFKDNNPHNQKIYIKNMRPYQLSGIINPFKANEIQYLIRFRKGFYYLDRQNNINEKEIDELWTKWYAISEEEYKNLTNLTIDNYFIVTLKTKERFQDFLKAQFNKIKNRIAFERGIEELDWALNNTGIKKAFDNEGNFIGEQLIAN